MLNTVIKRVEIDQMGEDVPVAIIMGVDPGSRITGIGILEVNGDRIDHVYHNAINATNESNFYNRITKIGAEFCLLLQRFKPDVVVIEEIFLGKNANSAFKLGHARGIFMYESLKAKIEVREYATRLVKKLVTGSGGSDKIQVQYALEKLLKIQLQGKIDASDALALAYHHAIQMEVERKTSLMKNHMLGAYR